MFPIAGGMQSQTGARGAELEGFCSWDNQRRAGVTGRAVRRRAPRPPRSDGVAGPPHTHTRARVDAAPCTAMPPLPADTGRTATATVTAQTDSDAARGSTGRDDSEWVLAAAIGAWKCIVCRISGPVRVMPPVC